MAQEIEITLADLGHPASEFGIGANDLRLFDAEEKTNLVKVFVDGALADPTSVTEKLIIVKPPLGANSDICTIVVTTKHDKIISVLEYDQKEKQIRKSVGESQNAELIPSESLDAGSALIKAIGDAAQKIAEAMAASNQPKAANGQKASRGSSDSTVPIRDR